MRPVPLTLTYHAVSSSWPAALSVRPERLERQLRYLLDRGYHGVTISEALDGERGGRALAITFDDSYRSVFQLAFPVLRRLELPATVFVPTAFAGAERPTAWPGMDRWLDGPHAHELVPMSWDELATLADAGWEIGSHTCSHPILTRIDDEALARELRESKGECELRLARPCRSFAYPYGAQDERVVRAVRAAGYEVACTTPAHLRASDPLLWPRIGVYHDESDLSFRAKVSPSVRRLRRTPVWPPLARALLRARGRGEPLPGSQSPG
jgi:peptidoglycan/xylan/chitin deacetylase (PgdA/CDA1 family)